MLRDKMLAVMEEVNSEAAERHELVQTIALALLSGSNLFILGAPGQAKSFVVNEFRKRITGAKQFERLLSRQTDEEALFGRLDLASLIPGAVPAQVLEQDGTYRMLRQELAQAAEDFRADPTDNAAATRMQALIEKLEQYRKGLSLLHGGTPMTITAGKIPDAHICFLDEIFKAADGLLNSLLTALNERRYTNEGVTVDIPVISFFSASNEMPNFRNKEEQILAPLYDRFQLRVVTKDVQERTSRLAVLRNKQGGHFGEVKATFSLDELYAMQAQVKLISVPEAVNELMDDVLCELRREGITVSDRTFFGYGPVAQAAAWLAGHAAEELPLERAGGDRKGTGRAHAPVRRPAPHAAGGTAGESEGRVRRIQRRTGRPEGQGARTAQRRFCSAVPRVADAGHRRPDRRPAPAGGGRARRA